MNMINEKRRVVQQNFSRHGLRFWHGLKSESGQGIAEYVIILAVIVIACIILAIAFHSQLQDLWTSITAQLGAIG